MRIHLGHHFYGAGNVGDDFMLAGFLHAMQTLAPSAAYTASVPFPLPPLQRRFPSIEWFPYESGARDHAIRSCDAWLGLGGSPFQSAQSRWFIDHLAGEAELCRRYSKPMFFLGVGVQTTDELQVPGVREILSQTVRIWTRDVASADKICAVTTTPAFSSADLAHLFFQQQMPAEPLPRQLVVVANFDYAPWGGLDAFMAAVDRLPLSRWVWLAQESRELPGAEKDLYRRLSPEQRSKWSLVLPDRPDLPLRTVIDAWPVGEWLVTSRYHAAIAGAWAGAKVIVIPINEKLRGAAFALETALLRPDADADTVTRTLASTSPTRRPEALASAAWEGCREFVARLS